MSGALIDLVDPLNFAVVRIEPHFDDTKLGDATGFFYSGTLNGKKNYWLVTNWHVLSGRNAEDPGEILHSQLALPNCLRLSLILKQPRPENGTNQGATYQIQELTVRLYDDNSRAIWYQHSQGNGLDVAVINTGLGVDRFEINGVNDLAMQNDMAVQIGNNVFILGYPLGFRHFINTPIWKRGSIASEPNLETPESRTRVVIDATTRQGMSGAPVIMREKTHYLSEDGNIKECANATRWIGIYASRPNIANSTCDIEGDRRPEVGYFYKMRCVFEAISSGVPGPDFGEEP